MINKFSLPMPYNKKIIDNLLDINKQIEKSKISSFYFSLPSNCKLFTIFEQFRNDFIEYSDFNYWKDLIKYSLDKGVDFIYNLNNPKNLPIENPKFEQELDKLDILLNELQAIGVNKLRISNHKLLIYLNNKYKKFTLYASTSFEYKLIKEYQHFLQIHPEIKQIVPSHDVNKNFWLLKNLIKTNPNINIELIVNEGCISGCSLRFDHSCEIMGISAGKINSKFSSSIYSELCGKTIRQNPILYLCKSPVIYPWEITEYNKIGIYNFKIAGREDFKYDIIKSINSYLLYLKGIDKTKSIEEEPINTLIHHIANDKFFSQFKIKDIKKFLPEIKHFVKTGHLCDSMCGVKCRYCHKCAEKIQKVFEKKQVELQKRTVPFCTKNK